MTMTHGFDTAALAKAIVDHGVSMMTDADGRRLSIVSHPLMYEPLSDYTPGWLIAYEKSGAIFWDFQKPMNQFLLTEYGFSIRIAPMLSDVLKSTYAEWDRYCLGDPVQHVALPKPEDTP